MNNKIAWIYKGYKLDKNEFGVLELQIAEKNMYLNILIKDTDDIHHLFHLYSVKILI